MGKGLSDCKSSFRDEREEFLIVKGVRADKKRDFCLKKMSEILEREVWIAKGA